MLNMCCFQAWMLPKRSIRSRQVQKKKRVYHCIQAYPSMLHTQGDDFLLAALRVFGVQVPAGAKWWLPVTGEGRGKWKLSRFERRIQIFCKTNHGFLQRHIDHFMAFHRFSRSCEALFLMPWPKLRTSHPFKDGCLDQS